MVRDAGEVGAGAGLGHRDGGDQLARGDPGQPARRLFVVAVLDEVRRADVVVQRQAEAGAADARGRQLLGEHDVEPEVAGPAAAVRLGDRHPEEAVLSGGGEHLARHDAGRLPVGVVRHHLLRDERGDGTAERLVVVVEQIAHRLSVRRPPNPRLRRTFRRPGPQFF